MNVQKKHIILFLLYLGSSFFVFSQPDLKFSTISIREGLSSNNIHDIIKDEFGFLWVATDDGLNRYDGQEIKVYRHDDSLKNSLVDNTTYCLFETVEHQLLLGTHDGLCHYNRSMETFDHFILRGVRIKHIIQS